MATGRKNKSSRSPGAYLVTLITTETTTSLPQLYGAGLSAFKIDSHSLPTENAILVPQQKVFFDEPMIMGNISGANQPLRANYRNFNLSH